MAYANVFTNDHVRHRILNVYAKFVSDVEPDRLCDWLVQEHVITIDQKQRIHHVNPIPSDRRRAILDHLFSIKHPRAFLVVRQALVKDNHYLLEEIDKQEPELRIRVGLQHEEHSVLQAKIQELESDLMRYRSVNAQLRKSEDNLKQRVGLHQLESELRSAKITIQQLKKDKEDQKRARESENNSLLHMPNELEAKLHLENHQNDYKSNPVLVQRITTKASKNRKEINGLAILGKELFVANSQSSEVEVYDSTRLSFSRRWTLKKLNYPWDITSCSKNDCLYIFDFKVSCTSHEILRVDSNGKLITNWSTGRDCGWGLSTTDESNVILTAFNKHKLNEYSPDGLLVREVILSSDPLMWYPRHAIKLSNGHYLVGHGSMTNDLLRVWFVDADGKRGKSFYLECASSPGKKYGAFHLSVDGNGSVLVADRNNGRVLLLDSELEFKREILSKEKNKLQGPSRILIDESNGRIIVADNNMVHGEGQILFFDFR